MLRRYHTVSLGLLIALLIVACTPATPGPLEPALPLEDCLLSTPGLNLSVSARCGTLTVPENREDPSGRRIDLNIAVVPAVDRAAQPDPLFILVGGPGQAAVEVYPALAAGFSTLRQTRDIVLVDQRGTGTSHPLTCELPEDDDAETEEVIAALRDCPPTLDADPRFYTTEIAMQDLDEVREALGYAGVNLYGISYGTRAALTYLRLFPERVRSLVLDAVVSPDYVLYLNTAQDADRALDLLFARCDAEAACREAFPAAREDFTELVAQLEVEPLTAAVRDPVTAEPLTVTLDHKDLLNVTFPLLYSPEIAALLPLSLEEAKMGNLAPLLAQIGASDAGLSIGMLYAVACTEDAPFVTEAEAAALAEGTLFGDRTEVLREVCSAWPQGELSPAFRQPVSSDVPVLLLSGEADPVTPPQYAERVAQHFPNSLHVIGPGMGHGLLGRGCIDRLVSDFISAGSVVDLDAGCAQQLAPPPFFVSPAGPATETSARPTP